MSYIEQNGYFTFDGVKSSDYGVWINGGGTYNAPARRFKEYTVPGRNGALTIDDGAFEEADHEYTAFIARDFDANIKAFRNQLMSRNGYKTLTDSYHYGEYYRARFMTGLEADVAPGGVAGAFTIKFRRDPRRFLLSGSVGTSVLSGGRLNNPTLFAARPLIRVTGYGRLTIRSQVITISNAFAYVDIDSETQNCYHGTDNANAQVSFQNNDFPLLYPGYNGITYEQSITGVTITPNWWTV